MGPKISDFAISDFMHYVKGINHAADDAGITGSKSAFSAKIQNVCFKCCDICDCCLLGIHCNIMFISLRQAGVHSHSQMCLRSGK